MGITTNEFRLFIDSEIKNMQQKYIELTSGDVHRELGIYPDRNHSMPSCCRAMKQLMIKGDIILSAPPKGNGASLTIRPYKVRFRL